MASQKEINDIRDAFNKIEGKLNYIPDKFCYWREKIKTEKISGELRKNKDYYKFYFKFIKNEQMKKNLAELRLCLDYYCSLFKLHKPLSTFEWHHRLVIFQILGAIYEGIFYDLIEYKTNPNGKNISSTIAKNKLTSPSNGFGNLKQVLVDSNTMSCKWNNYMNDLGHLRNTVHAKSLNNKQALFGKNPLTLKNNDDLLKDLDNFITYITSKY